ncbi:MAG: DUF433 domain-containing protein [bacterium]|nr:DUF433 domain-containing protein [bacterium]
MYNDNMKKITVKHGVLSGQPIFEGTRISVELVLDFLANGASTETVLEAYPTLSKEDIHNAIAYATRHLKEEKIYNVSL